MDACRLMRMNGSAVVTMLASSCPMNAPTQTVPTASHGAEWSALMRAGRRGSVRIRGVTRRGASGSPTCGHAFPLVARQGDRHHTIIGHNSARNGGDGRHLSPPGDGTMVSEIRSVLRSILR